MQGREGDTHRKHLPIFESMFQSSLRICRLCVFYVFFSGEAHRGPWHVMPPRHGPFAMLPLWTGQVLSLIPALASQQPPSSRTGMPGEIHTTGGVSVPDPDFWGPHPASPLLRAMSSWAQCACWGGAGRKEISSCLLAQPLQCLSSASWNQE